MAPHLKIEAFNNLKNFSKISNHYFHENCAICSICKINLIENTILDETTTIINEENNEKNFVNKCYERDGLLFCKMHYFKLVLIWKI